jgi:ACS family D-galactonate transporter-like MFS transporter
VKPKPDLRRAWLIVLMLFFLMFINFADKVVLGVTAPLLMRDMHISPSQYGYLASAFFVTFVLGTLPVGILADRISNKFLLATMAVIWSATQLPMIVSTTFSTLLASRVVLGAAEGPTTMTAQQAVYRWFRNEDRTLPASVMNQLGSSAGLIVGVPALTWITSNYSWHWAFGTLAVLGIVWFIIWAFIGEDGPLDATEIKSPDAIQDQKWTSVFSLLLNRTFVGAILCGFASYWGITLLTTWGINYFVKSLGVTPGTAGWLVSATAVAGAIVGILGGWISQRLSQKGVRSRISRGILVGAVTCVSGACLMLVGHVAYPAVAIGLFMVAFSVTSTVYTPCYAMIAEICPADRRGSAFGLFTGLMTCGGIVGPSVMGLAVEYGGGYDAGFAITGIVTLIAGTVGLINLNPERDTFRSCGDSISDR